jgi:hypothetical protein
MAKQPKPDLSNLDPLHAVVLSTLPGPTDAQKDGVGVGDHSIDLNYRVRVTGILRVGQSSETSQVNMMKPWALCKKLANHVPPAVLDDILGEFIQAIKDGRDVDEDDGSDLKDRVLDRFLLAGCACTIVKRGSVRFLGEADVQVEE